MTLARPMSATERAALADAVRDMRRSGIRPRDIIASGAPQHMASKSPFDVLRVRLNPNRQAR